MELTDRASNDHVVEHPPPAKTAEPPATMTPDAPILKPIVSSSTNPSGSIALVRLEGSHNYEHWAFGLRWFLTKVELWSIIDGTEQPPLPTPKNTDSIHLLVRGYQIRDHELRRILKSSLSKHLLSTMPSLNDMNSQQIWDLLAKKYQAKGLKLQMFLDRFWNKFTYQDHESLDHYIANFRYVLQEMASEGMIISDKSKIIHFVNCLNPTFRDKMFYLLKERDANSLSLEDAIDVVKCEVGQWARNDTGEANGSGNLTGGGMTEKNVGAKGINEKVVMGEMGKVKIKKEEKEDVMGFSEKLLGS